MRFWKKITSLRDAVELMHRGRLLLQLHNSKNGLSWYIIGGGEVSEELAAKLLARPDVQPSCDGLFGTSQTFKMMAATNTAAAAT
jgi:hypothetical protein